MKIRFLGTGPSLGVPVPTCHCRTCSSNDPKDKRLRSSIYIETDDLGFIIDCGPDFRQQVLRYDIEHIDFLLLTHKHNDHIGGLDDVRPFNYQQKGVMKIYGNEETLEDVKSRFYYSFQENPYPGAPKFELIKVLKNHPFHISGIKVIPIEVLHGSMKVFGYRIGDFAYLTDVKFIAEDQIGLVKGVKILVINALRPDRKHKMHFDLADALEFIDLINPEQAFITHLSHKFPVYTKLQSLLPENKDIMFAYDGLELNF